MTALLFQNIKLITAQKLDKNHIEINSEEHFYEILTADKYEEH